MLIMQALETQVNSFLVTLVFFFLDEKQSLSDITHDAPEPKTSAICYVPRLSQSTHLFKAGGRDINLLKYTHTHTKIHGKISCTYTLHGTACRKVAVSVPAMLKTCKTQVFVKMLFDGFVTFSRKTFPSSPEPPTILLMIF